MYMPEELEHYGSQESQDVNTPVSTVLKLFLLSLLLHIVYFQQLHLVLVMGGSMGLLQVLFHQLFHTHTHTHTQGDHIRHFTNQCDVYKVAKMVPGNWSDNYCNQSDAQPFMLLLELYSPSKHPAPFPV